MPVLRFLTDTNSVSDYFRQVPEVKSWIDSHRGTLAISTLTLAELRRGIELRPEGKLRRQLEERYRFILEDYRDAIYSFDEAAAVEWGRLMCEARRVPIPLDDSLIGAIARASELVVVTRNVKHFPGCRTVNPWDGKLYDAWSPR